MGQAVGVPNHYNPCFAVVGKEEVVEEIEHCSRLEVGMGQED